MSNEPLFPSISVVTTGCPGNGDDGGGVVGGMMGVAAGDKGGVGDRERVERSLECLRPPPRP